MNLIPQPHCLICGSRAYSSTVARNTTFQSTLPVAYCSNCQFYYVASLPDEKFLQDFYAHEYFEQSRGHTFHYRLKTLFADMRAQSQYQYVEKYTTFKPQGAVLEIGAADGTFLSHYKKAGWNVTGFEFNEYMIQQAWNRFGIELQRKSIPDSVSHDKSYDHIVLLHVLEHLQNPLEVLYACRELLTNDGFLYIELPHSPEPTDVSQDMLDYYLTTTHLYNFRPLSLSRLCEKAGFSIIDCSRYFYPVPGFLSNTSSTVGRILMNGSVHSFRIADLSSLALTCSTMLMNYMRNSNTLRKRDIVSNWQGVGDSLRLIIKK